MRKKAKYGTGNVTQIGGRWYVRYWERRNVNGTVQKKRASHCLGDVTTRGKRPPADIEDEAEKFMQSVKTSPITAERIVTVGDFVERVYLPWCEQGNKRPSTANSYRDIWNAYLAPVCAGAWLKNVRTFNVQQWLNEIGKRDLSRNTLKHIKSVVSAIFKHAKQQDYFEGENPARDTAVNPKAAEPEETYAYTLEEINSLLAHIPEPAATAFAIGAFAGLRSGEIEGLDWEDLHDGEIHIARSVWNGQESEPKTRKSRAPVPIIRQLAERLEMHRLRAGNPTKGHLFTTTKKEKTRQNMNNLLNRLILPALNRCEVCRASESDHRSEDGHEYKRDASYPEWHGWHAARRGLGSNLYRLGVPDIVIQRILRHANVSTTATYYIKSAADDVKVAMATLESNIPQPHVN